MKTSKSLHKVPAIVLVLLFSVFLLYTTLTGSDFPRAIYAPPHYDSSSAWQAFDSLNQNLVWHYWGGCGTTNLSNYLGRLDYYGMKSALRDLQYWTPTHRPYLVENYSWGQWDRWEAEINYDDAHAALDEDGTGWYFFNQYIGEEDPNLPNDGDSWRVLVDYDSAGVILKGPIDTWKYQNNCLVGEPKFNYPRFCGYESTGQTFVYRIRAYADYDPEEIDQNTTVFTVSVYHWDLVAGTEDPDTTRQPVPELLGEVKINDFDAPNTWQNFSWEETIHEPVGGTTLWIFWPDSVDLWIDWVDYYDMDRGRFIAVDSLRNATLDSIVTECQDLENTYGDTIALWAQSDEPWRTQWRIHKYINNALFEHMKKSSAVQTVCK